MNKAVIAQEGSPKDLYNFPKNKFVANFIGDANVVKAEIINKQSNIYELKLAEMNIKICLLYTSPSPRDRTRSRMPSSA